MNKLRIQQKRIKDNEKYKIYKNFEEVIKTSDIKTQTKYKDIQKDLNDVIAHFDKIKKKQIPKVSIFNDKKESNVNYNINNNIIYSSSQNENKNKNDSQYIFNYKLKEYKRPDSYIIYSTSIQNDINHKKKLYEASEADKLFLDLRQNFMGLEEFENIIIDLELNCVEGKDGKLNEKNAKKIIEEKYSKYVNYSDNIINHFKDRRTTITKSLIRKKWHKNKSYDKFLKVTFIKRNEGRKQIRKNHINKEAVLEKIKEQQKYTADYLLSIVKNMKIKETSNKRLLKIEELIFQSEVDKIKNRKIPIKRIEENNTLREDIEKELSMKIVNEKKELNKQDSEFPDVTLDTLRNDVIGLDEENSDEKIPNKKNNLRMRIRLNRNNHIVIDRYIQNENIFNPFDDSYNDIFNNYKKYEINEMESLDNNNFEKMYKLYNSNKMNNLNIFYDDDGEEDDTNDVDMNQFTNSYKNFLKLKRDPEK